MGNERVTIPESPGNHAGLERQRESELTVQIGNSGAALA